MTVAVIVVLAGGTLLFFAPSVVLPFWPWDVPPFNARFLGAIYLAEAVALSAFIRTNRWSPGRLALIVAVLFTVPATLGTLVHIDQLYWPGKRAALWFILYGAYILLPLLAFWSYRSLPPPRPAGMGSGLRFIVLATGAAFLAYGLASLAVPEAMTAFWPWTIDGLHGRVYAGIFISGGVGLLMVGRGAGREEVQVMGIATLVLGCAAISGLYIASATTGRAIEFDAGTWSWLALFVWFAVIGAALLLSARRSNI